MLKKPDEMTDGQTHSREEGASLYGGQAIIEGVMMKGPERTVAAVRAPDGKIVHKILREGADERKRNFWYKTPFLRGVLIIVDSMSVGYKALMFSADIADPESKPRNPLVENLMLTVSLIIALVIFKFIPVLVASLIMGGTPTQAESPGNEMVGFSVAFSAIEGVVKAGVIVAYMLAIRLWSDVRKVFQYHGAEHKTINAYEAGEELTVENVAKYPTFHPRCGTSFLFALILFSLVFALLFPLFTYWIAGDPRLAMNIGVRFAMHLIFLPIIASFGYEFIRWTARLDPNGIIMRILTWPGRLFQTITSLEPDRDMIEVALVSMNLAMGLSTDENVTAPEPSTNVSP